MCEVMQLESTTRGAVKMYGDTQHNKI